MLNNVKSIERVEFSESRIGAEKVVVNHSKENGIVGGVKNLLVASMVYLDTILKSEGDMNMINMAYIRIVKVLLRQSFLLTWSAQEP